MDKRISVIGIGADGVQSLTQEGKARIDAAQILYGGERQLAWFETFAGEKRRIQSPLGALVDDVLDMAKSHSIAILASGDPLFYGIGSTLSTRLGKGNVDVLPSVSSMQLAFARAGLAWQEAVLVSLHGKTMTGLAQKIHGMPLVGLLTDDTHTPNAIANYLMRFQMTEYEVFVAENIGAVDERFGWYALEDMATHTFSNLNVVLLKRMPNVSVPSFALGMDDEVFTQRKPDRGLITKREIRVLSLAELALRPGCVLWDIGACTGSVSIEALLMIPSLRVFAVEKNEGDLVNLRENQVKFRTDFVAIHQKAPDGLDEFPNPNAVFIGGSGGELAAVIRISASRLIPGGRIVVNAATIENLSEAKQTFAELGFTVQMTLVQTARSKPILNLTRFEGMNPVYLVTAWKSLDKEVSAHAE